LQQPALDNAYAWMTRQRELWERKLDTVEEYLREQSERRRHENRAPHENQPLSENRPSKEAK
jgi:hypothetical protein